MPEEVNFLCEIGTEEIPAGYMMPAIKAIEKILTDNFNDNRIDFSQVNVYGTPRRLVMMVSNLAKSQREEVVELKGPSVKVSYDGDNNPTKALSGFLKGNNLSVDDVFTKDTGKGEYVFARKKQEARNTEEIIPVVIDNIIKNLPFPKKMRWGYKNLSFPRPISYFLILFNNKVIPFEIEGISSSNKTRGHYIQHDKMIEIKKISQYEKTLKEHSVIVNHVERKDIIRERLIEAAKKAGVVLKDDEELLDIVTFLVEDPHIVTCEFKKEFLKIPDIALIAEMKEHQKYFATRDKEGKLSSKFLVVSNNPVTENVIVGNEKVVTARFNDADFFFNEDRKQKLEDRIDSLKNVLFHKELGSIYDKVERMKDVTAFLSKKLLLDEKTESLIQRAVSLSKTDLNTAMVIEFTSLQGQIGTLYALLDGEEEAVARAIDEHYKPRYQGDKLPENIISIAVSLAEKIDNLFGSYSVGNIPKGSYDPYALRRQSNAIVDMLINNEINISIKDILTHISKNYKDGEKHINGIIDFIAARAKTIFLDRGFRYDEIDACLSVDFSDYLELYRRAKSVHDFRKDDNFSQMLLSFKRMNNIVFD
ncbi:glycine--tRNA ligase subunit beta, partial [Spirochaetota bacterium]